MWLDWLFFKILTVLSYVLSIWSIILAYIWLADVKRERGFLNTLYFKFEKIKLTKDHSCSTEHCWKLHGSYQIFPVLTCEQRTIRLVKASLRCGGGCDREGGGRCKAKLCAVAGSTPKFCVSPDSFTYWTTTTSNNLGAPCVQPFSVEVTCPTAVGSSCCGGQDPSLNNLELEFESTGTYFQRCILHTVSVSSCGFANPKCCGA